MKNLLHPTIILLFVLGLPASAMALPSELQGNWHGLYRCGGSGFHFNLSLSDQNGRLWGRYRSRMNDGSPQGYPIDSDMVGVYDTLSRSFNLQGGSIDRRLTVRMYMAYDDSSQQLFGEVDIPNYGGCSFAIASHKDSKQYDKKIKKLAKFQPKRVNPKKWRQCSDDAHDWLTQLDSLPLSNQSNRIGVAAFLLDSAHFKPYFKRDLFDLNKSNASLLGTQLSAGCINQIPALGRVPGLAQLLSSYVLNQLAFSRADAWLNGEAVRAADRWQTQLRKTIEERDDGSPSDTALLRQRVAAMGPLLISQAAGLDADLQALGARQFARERSAALDQRIASTQDTLDSLNTLAQFQIDQGLNPDAQNEMRTRIANVIKARWSAAFARFLAQQSSPDAVRSALRPLQNQTDFSALRPYLPAGAEVRMDADILARRKEMLEQFAQTEFLQFEHNAALHENRLQSLENTNVYEQQLQQRYQTLLHADEFSTFNATRLKGRTEILHAHGSELIAKIATAQSESEIAELFARYLPEGVTESSNLIPFESARDKRLSVIAPFYQLANADYFDAIYGDDLARVRQLDQQYLANLRPLMEQGNEGTKQMTSLLGKITGGIIPSDYINQKLDENLNNLSLLPNVIAIYLFNYQNEATKRCLRKDAVLFKVTTTTPDTVGYNYIGVEISREYGTTYVDEYRVNREFKDIFRKIGTSTPESLGANLFDAFANGGKISSLQTSTHKLMNRYACDSPQIKRLEKNFIHLYWQLK